ncbi:PAS domain S-box protein [Oculatella sp. LEGE 06141]|uniref:sensor histidine kinase n=1 Tax=Oculatella sp. LEGE 06141 TaxID=1828648 RepID=UPI00187F2AEA|nr:ATP-binding protein [Oculatella sp. LEGE 06141]MBE9178054.1 PAS domain S-box protein [Oculatella sp. LEGE 06141]
MSLYYADIVQHLPLGLVIWELPDLNDIATFRLVEVNAIARHIFGLPLEGDLSTVLVDLKGDQAQPFPAFLQAESPELYADVIRSATMRDLGEIRYRQPQQPEQVFAVKAFPLPNQQVGAIFEDVSDRHRLEHALRRTEQKLVVHAQKTPLAVIEWNPTLEIIDWNPAAETLFGYSKREAIGCLVTDLIVPPDVKVQTEQAWRRLLIRKVGTSRTNENVTRFGDRIVCEWHTTPLVDEYSDVISIVSLVQNITGRKQAEAELKQFAAQLEQSNRELQDFASIASHDLQEPLRKIQAFGDRLKQKYQDALSEEGRDYLERMQNAARRMQELINDLLSFSRVTTKAQPFAPVDLNRIVRDVLSDLEIRIQQVNGRVELAPLPSIEADPTQMRQLFQNVIGNALKFYRPDQPPIVQIQSQILPISHPPDSLEATQLHSDDLAPGTDPIQAAAVSPVCQITIADNGIGFDEKYIDRIFSVFQRLHGRHEYEGTGVGLAICRKIVERHGGSITARSAPDQGATFIVTLPIHQVR